MLEFSAIYSPYVLLSFVHFRHNSNISFSNNTHNKLNISKSNYIVNNPFPSIQFDTSIIFFSVNHTISNQPKNDTPIASRKTNKASDFFNQWLRFPSFCLVHFRHKSKISFSNNTHNKLNISKSNYIVYNPFPSIQFDTSIIFFLWTTLYPINRRMTRP